MKFNPFTVLIAVYKNDIPDLFEKALSSIYVNTLSPTQVLLIVDGPIPDSISTIIDKYKIERGLEVHYLESNVGLAKALNIGLGSVKTEWVIRADSDDINLSNRFETLAPYMNESYDLLGSAIQEVDSMGAKLGIRAPPLKQAEIIKFARKRNPFNHMSVAFRVPLAITCGGYPDIYLKEDYGLWTSMLNAGARVINLPTPLVLVTAGNSMYKRRGGLRYVYAEIKLQKHLISKGISNVFFALIYGFGRSAVYLIPNQVRGIIYSRLLRK
jgi:glycosyltransferase involved in cell wall biosynthesis